MSVAVSEAQLRALALDAREKVPGERFIGVQAGPWSGGPRLRVGSEELEIVSCTSELALREALAEREGGKGRVLLLCSVPWQELAADVLARLARRRLFSVQPWQSVMALFRAREVDPRLAREAWLADFLLESLPPEGTPAVPSGVLDAETAWSLLLRSALSMDSPRPDAEVLLRWTLQEGVCARFLALPAEVRAGIARWLAQTAGSEGETILRAVAAGRGPDALAIGLVGRVLFSEGHERETDLIQARTRLEPWLGGGGLAASVALAFADTAEALVRKRLAAEGRASVEAWLKRADEVLLELGGERFAYRSDVLPFGFEQRITLYAEALRRASERLDSPLASLELAAESVRQHSGAKASRSRLRSLEMSLRLARALRARASGALFASFSDAAHAYLAEGSFIDRARECLWNSDTNPALAPAYIGLLRIVGALREAENRRFAELLAGWLRSGSSPAPLLPLERVLETVVAPLAREVPVLLLVADGMTAAVFRELAEDLATEGWAEIGPSESPVRRVGIAALPTITEVSRASLLCGALASGGQGVEKPGFARHPALLASSQAGHPPVLFHKGELVAGGEPGLAPAVRRALEKPAQRVVGVVVNAIDDFLCGGDQIRPRWSVEGIRPLGALLDAARVAGRVVVLTSDHGHVLERGLEMRRQDESAARFRTGAGAPDEGEIVLEGERVLANGSRMTALWSERVRFGAKQNGYHGGASPQEVVVPVSVFVSYGLAVAGWKELPAETPAWWAGPELPKMPADAPPPPSVVRPPVGQTGLLFPPNVPAPVRPAETPVAPAAPAWLEALFASPLFQVQRERAARMGADEPLVRRVLLALEARGGKLTLDALAQALSLPVFRCKSMLAAVRGVLNVDDYAILSLDESSNTVELKSDLLRVQFSLGDER